MKTILIVGATGMIGGLILEEALKSDEVAQVISISRRPSKISHTKLKEVIHDQFLDYLAIKHLFSNIDSAFFCIGVYTGSVTQEELKKVTIDYVFAFADMLKECSPNATCVFLSGMGADRSEKSKISFVRYKGIAENYLLSKNFKELYIFRPGYIYPITPRTEPNVSYTLYRFFYPLLNIFVPSVSVTSEHLAKAMFHAGMKGYDKDTLENKDILKIRLD